MDKGSLRKKLVAEREAMLPAEQERNSAKMVDFLVDYIGRSKAKHVGLYLPIRGEPDLSPLVDRLPGVTALLPVIGKENGRMEFRPWRKGEKLQPNRFGIMEPAKIHAVKLDVHDLLLVPCVAVDAKGVRLGYGGGYYDRYLARHQLQAIAVTYEKFLIKSLPHAEHDYVFSWIVTEHGLRSVSP